MPCPVPLRKIFLLSRRANQNYKPRRLVPERGALAIVTNVGTGCGGRGGVVCEDRLQGGLPVSDRHHVRRATPNPPSLKLRRTGTKPVETFCVGVCVRQNRVVLAPVAGAKFAEARQPNRRRRAVNPPMTVTRRIRRRGERGISRKAIVRGMPECSDCTCMLVCVFLCALCTRDRGCSKHPAFPAPSSLWAKRFCTARVHRAAGMRNCVDRFVRGRRLAE